MVCNSFFAFGGTVPVAVAVEIKICSKESGTVTRTKTANTHTCIVAKPQNENIHSSCSKTPKQIHITRKKRKHLNHAELRKIGKQNRTTKVCRIIREVTERSVHSSGTPIADVCCRVSGLLLKVCKN